MNIRIGQDSAVCIAFRKGAEESGNRIQMRASYYTPVQTGLCTNPNPCTMRTASLC